MFSSSSPRAARHTAADAPPSLWSLDELQGLRPDSSVSGMPIEDDRQAREIDSAYARGYDEGRRAGEAAEAARMRSALQALSDGATSIQEEGTSWMNNLEENITAVAVAVAKQILDRETTLDPSTVADLVQRALLEFPIEQSLTIRLNPANLAAISTSVGAQPNERPGAFGDRADVQWVSDPRVAPGGCVVEGRDRVIDGRVDSALERMYRRLSVLDA
jgi:flagellar biosynthesis/type III secretory pathway protein FliH